MNPEINNILERIMRLHLWDRGILYFIPAAALIWVLILELTHICRNRSAEAPKFLQLITLFFQGKNQNALVNHFIAIYVTYAWGAIWERFRHYIKKAAFPLIACILVGHFSMEIHFVITGINNAECMRHIDGFAYAILLLFFYGFVKVWCQYYDPHQTISMVVEINKLPQRPSPSPPLKLLCDVMEALDRKERLLLATLFPFTLGLIDLVIKLGDFHGFPLLEFLLKCLTKILMSIALLGVAFLIVMFLIELISRLYRMKFPPK